MSLLAKIKSWMTLIVLLTTFTPLLQSSSESQLENHNDIKGYVKLTHTIDPIGFSLAPQDEDTYEGPSEESFQSTTLDLKDLIDETPRTLIESRKAKDSIQVSPTMTIETACSPSCLEVPTKEKQVFLNTHQCLDPHTIIKKTILGQGRFGTVYSAIIEDDETLETFALKETPKLPSSDKKQLTAERITEEFLTLSFDNPYLVKGICVYETKDAHYLLMEYLSGGDLETVLAKESVSLKEILNWVHNVLEGLDYIHKKGYIHGDIRPSNIMIRSENNKAVIVDFGLSRQYPFRKATISLSYSAPELFTNQSRGRGVDFWALGVTIYELLVGARPFLHNKKIKDKTLFFEKAYFKFPQINKEMLTSKIQGRGQSHLRKLNNLIEILGIFEAEDRVKAVDLYISQTVLQFVKNI